MSGGCDRRAKLLCVIVCRVVWEPSQLCYLQVKIDVALSSEQTNQHHVIIQHLVAKRLTQFTSLQRDQPRIVHELDVSFLLSCSLSARRGGLKTVLG